MAKGNSVTKTQQNPTRILSKSRQNAIKRMQRCSSRQRNPFWFVKISPLPKKIKRKELLPYLQTYGEINKIIDIEVYERDSFSIGYVDFVHAEGVFNILSERNHQFGSDVSVWASINEREPAERLKRGRLYQPANEGASILSLNDDCLIEIFSYLPPLDFISIFDTCLRFRTVAPLAFASAYRIVDFGPANTDRKLEKFWKVLQNFGSSITKLAVAESFLPSESGGLIIPNKNLIAIADHCIGSLKSLNLSQFRVVDETDDTFVPKWQALFRHLEAIILKKCEINSNILSACNRLVHLEIRDINNFDGFAFEYCYPQLKTFIFTETDSENALLPSESFFKNHPNLEKIVIKRRTRHNPGVRMLNSLINYAGENLHSLQLRGFAIEEDMVPKLREIFNKLKCLKLYNFGKNVSLNLFSNETQLKEIDIGSIRQTNAFETVFPNLEMIKFDLHEEREEHKDDDTLIEFFRNQKNLKEIGMSNIRKWGLTDTLAFIVNDFKQLEKFNLLFDCHSSGRECSYINSINPLTNLKNVKKLTFRGVTGMSVCDKAFKTLISDTMSKDTIECLEFSPRGIDYNIIDSIAEFPNLNQLNLNCDWDVAGSRVFAGGLFTILKYLLTKLRHVSYVNIINEELLLDDKAYDELMEIAHQNKQKFNLFKRSYMSFEYTFEMEIGTAARGIVN